MSSDMLYEDLMRPDEDWRELGDPSERRRIQNRIAQRAYRRNMRERADKIDLLSKQLREYERLHLHAIQKTKDCLDQESTAKLATEKLDSSGSWSSSRRRRQQQASPPATASEEQHDLSLADGCQLVCMQKHPSLMLLDRQPSAQRSGDTPRGRTESLAPGNSSLGAVGNSTTPALGVARRQIESKDDHVQLPLSPAYLPGTPYGGFGFDSVDPRNTSPTSASLLHLAVEGNHVDTVKVLLDDERVCIDDGDSDGFTALQRAVMQGKSEIVKLLLEHGANIGQASSRCYLTPADEFASSFLEPCQME